MTVPDLVGQRHTDGTLVLDVQASTATTATAGCTGIFSTQRVSTSAGDVLRRDPRSRARCASARSFTVSLSSVRVPGRPGRSATSISKGSADCAPGIVGHRHRQQWGLQSYVLGREQPDSRRRRRSPPRSWDGKWHNIAITYDGTSTRLFLDGRDLGAGLGGTRTRSITTSPRSGRHDRRLPRQLRLLFTGDIDQVMVFDRPLPMTEIWALVGLLLNKPSQGLAGPFASHGGECARRRRRPGRRRPGSAPG